MWEALPDAHLWPQLLPREAVAYWVTGPFLLCVRCNTGRMVLVGKKDPSETIQHQISHPI